MQRTNFISISMCKQTFALNYLLKLIFVFSPNIGKYGPEKTPYTDTFHTVN